MHLVVNIHTTNHVKLNELIKNLLTGIRTNDRIDMLKQYVLS